MKLVTFVSCIMSGWAISGKLQPSVLKIALRGSDSWTSCECLCLYYRICFSFTDREILYIQAIMYANFKKIKHFHSLGVYIKYEFKTNKLLLFL